MKMQGHPQLWGSLEGGLATEKANQTQGKNMFEDICPLCSQIFPRDRLSRHIEVEPQRVREMTIRVIEAYHEGWSAEDGACEPCWKSFREAGRILNLLQQMKPKRPGQELKKTNASGEEEEAGVVEQPILS